MDWTYLAPVICVYSQLFVCIAALCVPSPPHGLDVLGASYFVYSQLFACIAALCIPSPPLGLDVFGASYLCIAQLCV